MTEVAGTSLPRLSQSDLNHLEQFGYCVVPEFCETHGLRQDLVDLRDAKHFTLAKIGHDGQIQDSSTPFRDIRLSETCSLWNKDHAEESLPTHPARTRAIEILQQLKQDLQTSDNEKIQMDPHVQEIMYAFYPQGGYYRRHVDAEAETTSTFRTFSFLLYLSPSWEVRAGGCLRLHFDRGMDQLPPHELPHFMDVMPQGGTLVVFRSDQVPHEVLTSFADERLALVGWFWAQEANNEKPRSIFPHEKIVIREETLTALRDLRDQVPGLKQKLEPQVEYQSGLLHDDNDAWGIVMPTTPKPRPKEPQLEDSNPLYWTQIAKFLTSGHVVTLSLGGVRLRKISSVSSMLVPLMGFLTTLDLSNTDLDPLSMVTLLDHTRQLKNLYLGGNMWPSADSVRQVAQAIPHTVEIVDFRYSNWTADDLIAFLYSDENTVALGRIQKLYLEGNPLGTDDGAAMKALSAALDHCCCCLRELFLGQCHMKTAGITALATTSCTSLKKMYVEGNGIGAVGAQALLESKLIHSLEKLYMDNNDIPKDLALKIGQAVGSPTMIGEGGFYQDK